MLQQSLEDQLAEDTMLNICSHFNTACFSDLFAKSQKNVASVSETNTVSTTSDPHANSVTGRGRPPTTFATSRGRFDNGVTIMIVFFFSFFCSIVVRLSLFEIRTVSCSP